MFNNDLFSWFSSKEPTAPEATWDATIATIQKQPISPEAPSTHPVVIEEPNSEENMKLRGGGFGEVCCGVLTALCCFECCEDCC
ncbi:uncharacterized protein N7529_002394 [Penicillium soppii]|uniref:uncharacterized protein n=1 Tax=Penicillium soppii TaxID=69789 RepID=UPI002547AD17|nr:uncharacterized protein N7529_002394 [Penicillium soppii]KAJ5873964.1 hypothetical protein N7529_002394 [Penicillium soppii]